MCGDTLLASNAISRLVHTCAFHVDICRCVREHKRCLSPNQTTTAERSAKNVRGMTCRPAQRQEGQATLFHLITELRPTAPPFLFTRSGPGGAARCITHGPQQQGRRVNLIACLEGAFLTYLLSSLIIMFDWGIVFKGTSTEPGPSRAVVHGLMSRGNGHRWTIQ